MKIVFITNYMNHHQLSLCDEWYKLTRDNFYFIATDNPSKGRKELGYDDMNCSREYIIREYDENTSYDDVKNIISEANIIIVGGISSGMRKRFLSYNNDAIVFYYEERYLKGEWKHPIKNLAKIFLKRKQINTEYKILAASGYMKGDCKIIGLTNEIYEWGYFPNNVIYKREEEKKLNHNNIKILWAGRLIKYKRPFHVLYMAKKLKKQKLNFSIDIIGSGNLYDKMHQKIKRLKLENEVNLCGSVPYYEMINYYRNSDIFVMTSDSDEGWGAVVNEAMSQGCASVVYKKVGSAPYLINNGINGLIYSSKKELVNQVYKIFDDNVRKTIQINAQETIEQIWNYKNAAESSYLLFERMLNNEKVVIDSSLKNYPCKRIQ